ncbi:MAG: hypothetical protein J0I45_21810 [Bosea sp.]|nr:hypothetical protein [Bosea sp. (in: a-proteobacteria)]
MNDHEKAGRRSQVTPPGKVREETTDEVGSHAPAGSGRASLTGRSRKGIEAFGADDGGAAERLRATLVMAGIARAYAGMAEAARAMGATNDKLAAVELAAVASISRGAANAGADEATAAVYRSAADRLARFLAEARA